MLYEAAAGLDQISQNKLDFYVDAVGVPSHSFGPATKIRYNCCIRIVKKAYLHLLFQVTSPSGSAFDAEIGTPEGEKFSPIKDETELIQAIRSILNRSRTKEVIAYLLRLAPT